MDAIRATLDAAYIQGFLGFFGALIGAVALIISIRIAAKNNLESHKQDKLSDAKKSQYLDFNHKFQEYFYLAALLPEKEKDIDKIKWDTLQNKYLELLMSIGNVSLITTSTIRLDMFKFEKEIHSFQKGIYEFYFNNKAKPQLSQFQDKQYKFVIAFRYDLGIYTSISLEDHYLEERKNYFSDFDRDEDKN